MIDYLEIEGYKSIKELKIELKPINILIGSNGAGKSNFISFFKLLRAIFNRQFRAYALKEGAENMLYYGLKKTLEIQAEIHLETGGIRYFFSLTPIADLNLLIKSEGVSWIPNEIMQIGLSLSEESSLYPEDSPKTKLLWDLFKNLQTYHFNDTTTYSNLRKSCEIEDNQYLKHDGANLPACLYYIKLKHPIIFKRIEKTVKSIAPFLSHFILEPSRINEGKIELRWTESDDPDSNFGASQFSDGTIRFIALATLLLQPDPPKVIIIDEPELGLHPSAITKLAGMINICSNKSQIIISTQSVSLVDQFDADDIITVDRSREEKQSIFRRLKREELAVWLEGHTMGDLWERNIIDAAQPFKK